MIRDLPGAIPPSEQSRRIMPEDLAWPEQTYEDEIAMQIVLKDVEATESFLVSRNYPKQWDMGDRLFYAYVPPDTWPGTQTPRSSMGMPLLSTHLFSLLSSIVQALFSGNKPIQIDPKQGTTSETAAANQALVMWELEQCGFRQELIHFLFDMLLYGTGNMWWGFKPMTRRKRKKVRKNVAPVLGEATKQENRSELETEESEDTWVLPTAEFSHIRHYGVDPKCRRSDIRTGRFAWRRIYITAQDLDEMRETDGYQNIPSREQLEQLTAPEKESATANPLESGSYQTPSSIGRKAVPRWQDTTADPLKQDFECIEYWTPERTITVFERQLVIRNDTHNFRKVPSLSSALFMSPDSYYGMGLTQLIGNFQRVMQGVVNLYLDDLSLNLNGMYVTGKGYNNSGQAIWASPGKVVKVDDAQQFKPVERQPVGPDAMSMIASCQTWSQQADGANDIAIQGTMPTQNSSITRTGTGAGMLGMGARTRLEFLIDNIADLVIVPLVMEFMELNFDNLAPEQIKTILGEELGHAYAEDPLNIINGSYKVTVSAGARLQARNAIAQQWPMIMQMITSPAMLAGLQQEGKKVAYDAVIKETFRAAGYPSETSFIVSMTPEDLKRMQEMNPAMNRIAEIQAKAQAETDKDLQVEEGKAGGRALITAFRHALEVEDRQSMSFGASG